MANEHYLCARESTNSFYLHKARQCDPPLAWCQPHLSMRLKTTSPLSARPLATDRPEIFCFLALKTKTEAYVRTLKFHFTHRELAGFGACYPQPNSHTSGATVITKVKPI